MSASRRAHREPDSAMLLKTSKIVGAEMRNKIEATQLARVTRVLERAQAHARFRVDKEKRAMVRAMAATRETSGVSERGEPAPRGRFDAQLRDCAYFRSASALSEKQFERWRATDRQLRRLLRLEEEASRAGEQEGDGGLEAVLKGLGYGADVEAAQRVAALPRRPRSAALPGRHAAGAGLLLPATGGRAVRAWERQAERAYIAAVVQTHQAGQAHAERQANGDRQAHGARAAADSREREPPARVRRERGRAKVDVGKKQPIAAARPPQYSLNPPIIIISRVDGSSKCVPSNLPSWETPEEGEEENGQVARNVDETTSSDGTATNTTKTQRVNGVVPRDEYDGGVPSAEGESPELDLPAPRPEPRPATRLAPAAAPALSSALPQWKRDLMLEAPPGLSSVREPLKVALVMSKVQRQRELVKLVDDNVHDERTLVRKEHARRLSARYSVYGTLEVVRQAVDGLLTRPWRP